MTNPHRDLPLPPAGGGAVVVSRMPDQHSITAPQTPITPQAMLSAAVAAGNTELAGKLMDLVERWEIRQARKAFDQAITQAKAEIPIIIKRQEMGEAGSKKLNYKYEDMAAIARVVDPILSKLGLGYRFRTHCEGDLVNVICIVFHSEGHSEENDLSSKPDISGGKNPAQAVGSTVTFLSRYTLKAALGLAASADDDAGGGSSEAISDDQTREVLKLIEAVKADADRFCAVYKIAAVQDLPASKFSQAVSKLKEFGRKNGTIAEGE